MLNSVTSIVTFLMVFIIQSSQSRDGLAMQAKLDGHSRVMMAVAHKLGVDDVQELLELVAVEEAPERRIHQQQEQARRRG